VPTLTDKIDAQVAALRAEQKRIVDQAAENLAVVNDKLTQLEKARAVVTPAVEAAYGALRALKLIQEI
jgi:hypothetical protein